MSPAYLQKLELEVAPCAVGQLLVHGKSEDVGLTQCLVTGIPRRRVPSPGPSVPERWTRMPVLRFRPPSPGTVTSTSPRPAASSPQSSAALRWLRSALRPSWSQARTAAIQRPSGERPGCPAAYTPLWRRCKCPRSTRLRIASLEIPASRSCLAEITPCWRAAIAATVLPALAPFSRIRRKRSQSTGALPPGGAPYRARCARRRCARPRPRALASARGGCEVPASPAPRR
jgi:hypothetical protein